jgi:cobyrinic acid a,c-diamide synthase
VNLGEGFGFAYRGLRGHGLDGRHDGLTYKNLLASFIHLRDVESNRWVGRFVRFVRENRPSPRRRVCGRGVT